MNDTDLVVILDRSGSMETGRSDHEGGLRSFVRDQRSLPGRVCLTFVRFDSHEPFELVHDRTPLEEVDEAKLELVPRGGTPLLEAVGRTLEHLKLKLAADPGERLVIVMIITDGMENASRGWTKMQVSNLIKEREAAGWKVLYLGANVDAFAEAGGLGIGLANAINYAPSGRGAGQMYSSLTDNVKRSRQAYSAGDSVNTAYSGLEWSDDQRSSAMNKEENK